MPPPRTVVAAPAARKSPAGSRPPPPPRHPRRREWEGEGGQGEGQGAGAGRQSRHKPPTPRDWGDLYRAAVMLRSMSTRNDGEINLVGSLVKEALDQVQKQRRLLRVRPVPGI